MSMSEHPAPRRLGVTIAMAIAALAAFAVLIALGTWQVQRLHWKEGLIATIDARSHAEPVPFLDIAGRDDVEYLRVRLSGRFVHEAERHFFTTMNGQSGFNVYTPLVMANGEAVFVNRGFVPYDRKEPGTRPQGQVQDTVEIVGLARKGLVEKPSAIVPDNAPEKNLFYWKDIRAMRESSGLDPAIQVYGLFVDADAAPNPGGLPVGGATIVDLPNNHLQYAITWYGLALALVGVVAAWLLRRFRAKP